MENQVLKALKERRSVRKYKAEQITDAELTAVLEAGTYAATGKGLQDPWIVAVQNEEIKAQLIRMNAEVMGTQRGILTMMLRHSCWSLLLIPSNGPTRCRMPLSFWAI